MSTTIDKRVVEMRFDNKHFESNVQTSMSTLDKLREKLNLSGAAKGLEDINAAAKNVDMSGMGNAVETVRTKFSALEVVAVTALANIANSAVNAGKKLVASLTIDPIMDGFKEYELTLNAIQTTMAGTGKTANEVAEELKKLDEYADKTVYSTADMLNNLPKFTNAGVELEVATKAMIGIANATALAGGDAQKASIAFYNLGQAIGTGYLTRMDYNSINNAGIATMEWKNQMVEAAIAMGTLKKVGDDLYTAGGDAYTLQQLFIDGLKDQWATTEVMTKVFNDYADETTEIGKKSYAAATEIKTFTMMMDSLKASAGTGWKDTWEILFGGLDQAKQFWTGLYNVIAGVLDRMTEWRNNILKSALGKSFTDLSEKVKGLTKPLSKMSDVMKTASDAVKDYSKVVKEIISGDWGNGQKRWDALTKAGYDWAHAQNLVNEELGCSVRHVTKYTEAQGKSAKTTAELTESEAKHIAKLAELSDAELKALGYTDKQIEAFRELKAAAEKLGLPLDEFISKIDKIDGRWLAINAFKNIGDTFGQVAKVIKQAWTDIFPDTSDKIANGIFNVITAFHKLTTSLGGFVDDSGKLTESGEKLKTTFEGIFAAVDILLTVTSGPLGIAFRILKELFEALDIPILDITSAIADVIIKFNEWLDSVLDFSGVFEKIVPYIKNAIDAVRDFFNTVKDSKFVEVGKNIVLGLANGIKDGAILVWNAIENLAKTILTKIKAVLGIHSPSTETYEIGTNLIQGLANGIKNGSGIVWEGIRSLCKKMIEVFKNFDWGMISDALWVVGSFFPSVKILPILRACANFAKNAGDKIIESLKNALGIHSPSTETHEIGMNLIQGLVNGIKNGAILVWNAIKALCSGIIDTFKNFDLSSVSAIFWTVSSFLPTGKITNIIAAIANLAAVFGENFKEAFSGVGKNAIEGLKEGALSAGSSVLQIFGKIITGIVNFVKSLLGIHSPSKVFFAIGGFIIAGLVGGLLGNTSSIKEALQTIGNIIVDFFSGLDIQTVIAAGIGVGALLIAKQVADIFKDFGKAAKGFGHLADSIAGTIDTINNGVTGKIQPSKWTVISKAIERVALAIGILVASVIVLSKIPSAELWPAIGALTAIATIVGLLGFAMAAIQGLGSEGDIEAMGNTLIKISAAMGIMVLVAKVAAGMSVEEMLKGGAALVAFGGIMTGLMAATKLISANDKSVSKIGGSLMKISIAMGIMLTVAKIAAGMSTEDMLKGAAALVAFGGIMVGFMAATKLVTANDKSVKSIGGSLLKISIAMGVMIVVAKVAAGMSVEEMLKGAAALVAFGGILVGFMAATNLVVKGSKNVGKIGGALLKISIAMAVMIVVAKLAASMSIEEMLKGGAAIVAFGGIIVGFMAATNLVVKGSKNVSKIGGALFKIAAAMGIMVVVAKLASSMSLEEMLKGTLVVTAFGGIIVGLMAATQLLTKNSKSIDAAGTALLKMAGAIAIIAVTAALLSLIKPERLGPAVAALTVLMTAFALVVSACKISDKVKTASVGQLILMTAIVGALAGIVAALSFIPNPDAAVPTASALSILLTSLSVSMAILSKVKGLTTDTIANAMLMSTVVGILGGILLLLSSFDVQPSIETASALSILLTSLSASMAILSLAKGVDAKTVGIVGIMAAIIAALGAVIGLLEKWDLAPSIETAITLSTLLLAMSAALLVLTPVGAAAGPALAGMGVLAAFIAGLAGIIAGLGALTKIDGFTEIIQNGGEVLASLGYALGNFVGSIIGGFSDGALSGLPAIGKYLSEFMTNASVFFDGVTSITDTAAGGAKSLCAAIMALTAAELLDSVSALMGTETSLATLGTELSAFMTNVKPFLDNIVNVKPEILEGVKALAETILILTAAEVVDGLSSKLFGSEDGLASFAAGLPILGTALASFVTSLGTFGEDTVATVTCAANAVKSLAEAADSIPNEGGWVAKLVGENSLAAFGDQLPSLGTALSSFVANLTANGAFGEDTVATVTCAGNAIKALAAAASGIDGQADWAKKLFGDNSLASFSSQLGTVGTGLSNFVKNLGTFSEEQVSTVKSAVNAIKALTGLANADLKGAKKHLTDFGDDLSDFAGQLASFCKDMPSTETVNAATSNIKKIINTVSDIVATKTEAIANFAKSLKNLAKSGIDSFVKELNSENAKADTTKAGEKLVGGVIDGIESKDKEIKSAGTASAEQAVEGVETQTDDMESAGKDLGSGLVTGIEAKKQAAYDAGYALGQAAVQGEKDGQKSNSPSKLTIQAGHWLGDGLVIGMKHMVKKVRDTGYNLGDSATKSISGTIAAIAASVDTDMDMQPTIRPVVDLSEVRASANAVGGMFSSPSVGVLSNVRAISSAMNRRNQNGANEDVVSAIKDLKKSMPAKAGDTYTFGNLSYEEGTEVGDAIKSLVRAIRVERRV